MKNLFRIIIIGLLVLSIFSCQSKKSTSNSESKFYTDSIYSKQLTEYRKHNIYLPRGFNKNYRYPIIFATDGNSDLTEKKQILDSLIDKKIINPLIFITSFSNNKIADSTSTTYGNGKKVYLTYRNFEYVDRKPTRIEDSLLIDRFQNHMLYFVNELMPQVEKTFNQNNNKKDRYFYGVSNGAGFGLSLLNKFPDKIGTYICFSTFGGNVRANTWKTDTKYPNLYLRYGSEEPYFLKEDAEFLKSKYAESDSFSEIKEFDGGHDSRKWTEEFTEIISRLLRTE